MRIVVDVNLPPEIVDFLIEQGHDAVYSATLLSSSSPDADVVARAVEEGRIVLTRDLGIAEIILNSGRREPSLITMRLGNSSTEILVQALASQLAAMEEPLLHGALVTIDEKGARAHPRARPSSKKDCLRLKTNTVIPKS